MFPECDIQLIRKKYSAYEMDEIDAEEFWMTIGGEERPDVYLLQFMNNITINPELDTIINTLKERFDFAILSNIPKDWKKPFAELIGKYFNEILVSGQVGYGKPDPKFYLHLCDISGYSAHECILIDDNKDNLAAAFELGMKTVWMRIEEQPETIYKPFYTITELHDVIRIL